MVVEFAGVTQHEQMLVLVLLADATAAGKHDIMYEKTIIFSQDFGMQKSRNTEVRHIYQNSGV